jgi:hypothetical protein
MTFPSNDDTDRDPDRLPDSTDPSGPCPRCGRVSNFSKRGEAPVTYDGTVRETPNGRVRGGSEQVAILECNGCGQCVVVIEERLIGGVRADLGRGRGGAITWRGIHWWPTPGAGSLDPSVPANVAASYAEGIRCLSANAPHGAVALLRTSLAYIVQDKGSEAAKAKKSLNDAVKQMVADGALPTALTDWVTHIRELGNAGAHPDVFGEVSVDEARDLQRLVEQLIQVLYVVPASIAKARAARPPR